MIVRRDAQSLLFITQPDHARLSAELLSAFALESFTGRPTREAVLEATRQHDIGWVAADEAPGLLEDGGEPYDFMTAPLSVRQQIWPRAVALLRPRSSYVAALVAQHAVTVYRRYGSDPGWHEFFETMERLRDACFSAASDRAFRPTPIDPPSADRTAFLQDYAFLATCDVLSLVFCNGWTDRHDVDIYQVIWDGQHLRVDPDPFGGRTVAFGVRARRVDRLRFGSDDDLRSALAAAPEVTLTGVACGPAG